MKKRSNCTQFCILLLVIYATRVTQATKGNSPASSNQILETIDESPEFAISQTCQIRATDQFLHKKILQLLVEKVKLINYKLYFANYTTNPLLINSTWSYKADNWARVSSQHGQTLLSLAFNYGILSMMTLTFGVESLEIELEDIPYGCVMELNEREKNEAIMSLLMRDFKEQEFEQMTEATPVKDLFTLLDDERVCHELITNMSGYAKFTDRCCNVDLITKERVCTTELTNKWLSILHGLLAAVKFSMMFFGPLLFIPMIEIIAKENIPYAVELKEPLKKKIILVQGDTPLCKLHTGD